ncbi:hypothetical protein EVAR_46194_1 [Eumeta japonica]|uniref:Uncharacterized protein n=1 Tax=Eumeta variegata TaxID=151549 RepID=A0A4C1WCQ2_EUMVA|nr:hypothetical protein EVAR_46194_1 [Eumeta japonica]
MPTTTTATRTASETWNFNVSRFYAATASPSGYSCLWLSFAKPKKKFNYQNTIVFEFNADFKVNYGGLFYYGAVMAVSSGARAAGGVGRRAAGGVVRGRRVAAAAGGGRRPSKSKIR